MTSVPPEEILSDLDRLRRQARTARHAYWFPLVLFGLLTWVLLAAGAGSFLLRPRPGRA